MINNFDNYIELEDSYKNLMSIASICKSNLDLLIHKYNHNAVSYGYYMQERKRWEKICKDAQAIKYLRDSIYLNQKTNKEMLEIILEYVNSHQSYKNQEYNIKIVQDTDSKDIYSLLYKQNYEFKKTLDSKKAYLVLLVKSTISDSDLANEEFNDHIEAGDIVLVDIVDTKLNNQNSINAYLKKKTINLDKVKGLYSNTEAFIKDRLFNDYKIDYNKKESEWINGKTKKILKKEEH